MPFFSIILPTYNRGRFISKAINSVLQQTFNDFELIIIDDGSTDNTKNIVSVFKDERLKYYFQDNQEKSVARNNGINKALGKYICFIDSDDYYLENHIEVFFNEIKRNNYSECVYYSLPIRKIGEKSTNEIIVDYHPENSYTETQNRINEYLLFHSPLVQTSCFHKSTLQNNKFNPNLHVTECYDLMGRIAISYNFIKIEKYTAVILSHGENSTTFNFRFLLKYENEWSQIIKQSEFNFLKGAPLFNNKIINVYLGIASLYVNEGKKKMAMNYLWKTLKLDVTCLYNRQFLGVVKKIILN